jgi:hypothetical protein
MPAYLAKLFLPYNQAQTNDPNLQTGLEHEMPYENPPSRSRYCHYDRSHRL